MNMTRRCAVFLLACLLMGCTRQVAAPPGSAKSDPKDNPAVWPISPEAFSEEWPPIERLFYPTKEEAAAAARSAIFVEGGPHWRTLVAMACQVQSYDQFQAQAKRVLDSPWPELTTIRFQDVPPPSHDALEAWETVTTGFGKPSLTGEPRAAYGVLWQIPEMGSIQTVSVALIFRGQAEGWCLEMPQYARHHSDSDAVQAEANYLDGIVVSVRPKRR